MNTKVIRQLSLGVSALSGMLNSDAFRKEATQEKIEYIASRLEAYEPDTEGIGHSF